MPDSRFSVYEHHNTREQAALARGVAQTRRDLIEDGKKRALGLMDDLADAFDEIEREAPEAMRYARLLLADARSEVEGTR